MVYDIDLADVPLPVDLMYGTIIYMIESCK